MKSLLFMALVLGMAPHLLFGNEAERRVDLKESKPKLQIDTSGRHEIASGLYLEIEKHADDPASRFTIGKNLADGSGDAMTHYPLATEGHRYAFYWEAGKKRLWVVSELMIGYFDLGSLDSEKPYEKYDASYLNGHPIPKWFVRLLPRKFEKTVRKFHEFSTKQKS